jgi:FAD/FMN-containing dehydrogenase
MTTTTLGEILRPGDPGYDQARKVWNGTVDRYPALIARCRSTEEVAAAVRLAATAGLEIAVRGGGHSIPGLSVCEGGLMIDLSPMKRLEVDVEQQIARAEPGLLWGEYDALTQAHGLASPGGEISHTGVAGLTLGGGIGWLSRRHGLACDNLVGATVVLADGTIHDVDDATDADLLWGLRGGGGNFGIVTEFRFRVHRVPSLFAGMVAWPAEQTAEVLGRYISIARDAPRDLSLTSAQLVAPPAPFVPEELHFRPIVAVAAMWTGDADAGPEACAAIRSGGPAIDTFGISPYTEIQRWFDDGVPHGRRYHVRSEWLGALDDGAVEALSTAARAMSSPFNQILVRRLGGAISDVDADATAFRYRAADYMLTIASGWDDGDDTPHVDWTRQSWEQLHPWSCGGSYVNHLAADEGADRVREAYGEQTWNRLLELKRRYDPANVFHLNQNVNPS